MARILVDFLYYTGAKGGMESYVREIFTRMSVEGIEFVGLASRQMMSLDNSWFPGELLDSGVDGENRVFWAAGEVLSVGSAARRVNAQLVYSPANLGPWGKRPPSVLTVHDLLPFRHPEYIPAGRAPALRLLVSRAARAARRIITISETSKRDIVDILGIPGDRVDVIHLGGREPRLASTQRNPRLVLAVGNRLPHKNFPALVEAIALIPEANRPHLVLTGSHGADPLRPLVERLGLEAWVTLRDWVSNDEIEQLFSEASVVVVPSLFEGFGLPVLDGMTHGAAVICSDIPALREVGGNAAIYTEPTAHGLSTALHNLMTDPGALAAAQEASLARAKQFSWERAASQTMDSLRRALG